MKKWLKEHKVEIAVGLGTVGIFACVFLLGYKVGEIDTLADQAQIKAEEAREVLEQLWKQLEEDPEVEITHF